jgi:hypothetical protein
LKKHARSINHALAFTSLGSTRVVRFAGGPPSFTAASPTARGTAPPPLRGRGTAQRQSRERAAAPPGGRTAALQHCCSRRAAKRLVTESKPRSPSRRHASRHPLLLSTIDNPAARNLYLDVRSTNPMGVAIHDVRSRAERGSHRTGAEPAYLPDAATYLGARTNQPSCDDAQLAKQTPKASPRAGGQRAGGRRLERAAAPPRPAPPPLSSVLLALQNEALYLL